MKKHITVKSAFHVLCNTTREDLSASMIQRAYVVKYQYDPDIVHILGQIKYSFDKDTTYLKYFEILSGKLHPDEFHL